MHKQAEAQAFAGGEGWGEKGDRPKNCRLSTSIEGTANATSTFI
jgi:hypothetical protein